MNRQRIGKSKRSRGYQSQLRRAMAKHLPRRGLSLQKPDQRLRWTDRMLVIGAILIAWQRRPTVQEAFELLRHALVRMYPSRRRPGSTVRGFIKAIIERGPALAARLKDHLRQRVIAVVGSRWRWKRWVVMAVDGSRVECPRTAANEKAFGCGGRGKTTPQQWVTSVFHVVSGLMWDYRTGKATDSERGHLRDMLASLPQCTLLLMDAGFTGFELLGSIIAAGHDFIVRVGGNVTLLRQLYDIQDDGSTVWLWPTGRQGIDKPLRLRKVEFLSNGRKVCLLTSVPAAALGDDDVKLWYRQRWMIEVKYRSLKQTMEQRKLLSDSPSAARAELDWALIGLWLLELMQCASRRWGRSVRYSLAKGLRAVRQAIRGPGRPRDDWLHQQLRHSLLDKCRRVGPKRARDWPHKKNDPPCGWPNIRMAKQREIRMAQALDAQNT